MVVVMVMMVVMVMIVTDIKNKHGSAIHYQAKYCNEDGLIERDLNWIDQAQNTFESHHGSEDSKQDRPGIASQGVYFASAKTVALIMSVAACVNIGESADSQGDRMTAHVQPIRQQCHRAKGNPGGNFDNHHAGC